MNGSVLTLVKPEVGPCAVIMCILRRKFKKLEMANSDRMTPHADLRRDMLNWRADT